MAHVWLYSTEDGVDVVDKNLGICRAEIHVDVMPGSTLKNPELRISAANIDLSRCNYFYLKSEDGEPLIFNRYYYLLPSSGVGNNGIFILRGEWDPLKSFAGEIYGLDCLIVRNEFEYNGDIVDEEAIPRVTRQLTKKVIGNVGKTVTIALTVAGGGSE